jgi:Fe-Mn family superoxide dismutase
MTIELGKLPYEQDALEPHVSARTFSYHYGKHHRAYVNKLNELIANTPLADLSLEDIVDKARESSSTGILNNALQTWNHAFLWESMAPDGGGEPEGRLKRMIESSFGDVSSFKEQFALAALSQFGSGWVWLVQEGSQLKIMTTGNAESPLNTDSNPLLTLDVWEHAYYLDYQNDRKAYTDTFLEHLINWDFAAANLRD